MKMKNIFPLLFSFLLLFFFFVTGAIPQETIGRSPSGESETILGPTGMPGLGGWSGFDQAAVIAGAQQIPAEEKEKIAVGDTGEPGLGGLTGSKPAKPFFLIPTSDENNHPSSELLGNTAKPGLGGSSGSKI